MNYEIIQGDCLEKLDEIETESVDCIITDPPYELNFMGKGWDNAGVSFDKNTWEKCLKVLKPGGYLLAFGGTRTYHRIACAIEDAGFEIRDCIMWLYGSGFPKASDIGLAIDKRKGIESKVVGEGRSGGTSRAYQSEETTTAGAYQLKEAQNEWRGWKSALKPAYEPIIMARKPFKGSLVDNVLENGVGGLNIDECRVGDEEISVHNAPKGTFAGGERGRGSDTNSYREHTGRYPANLILTYNENDYDEVCGGFPNTKSQITNSKLLDIRGNNYNNASKNLDISYERGYSDSGSAARYFYCAKASKKDRDEGLDSLPSKPMYVADNEHGNLGAFYVKKAGGEIGDTQIRKNTHPTVKPTSLMQYLVRLVAPKGATILDPFMGSGSTGKAVAYENIERNKGYKFVGIEKDPEYCKIAKERIGYVITPRGL